MGDDDGAATASGSPGGRLSQGGSAIPQESVLARTSKASMGGSSKFKNDLMLMGRVSVSMRGGSAAPPSPDGPAEGGGGRRVTRDSRTSAQSEKSRGSPRNSRSYRSSVRTETESEREAREVREAERRAFERAELARVQQVRPHRTYL